MMKRAQIAYGILLCTLWVVLTGSLMPSQLLLGACVAGIVYMCTFRLIPEDAVPYVAFRAGPVLAWYTAVVIAELSATACMLFIRVLRPQPQTAEATAIIALSTDNKIHALLVANALTLTGDTAVIATGAGRAELIVTYEPGKDGAGEHRLKARVRAYESILGRLT